MMPEGWLCAADIAAILGLKRMRTLQIIKACGLPSKKFTWPHTTVIKIYPAIGMRA